MLRRLAPRDGRGLPEYRVLRTLGQGSYGKVKLAVHRATGTEVAIKIIRKARLARPELLAREVGCMRLLQHPNIIQLFEAVDTRDRLLLVMELAGGGDLHEYLRWRRRLDEREARHTFAQALAAVAHCHERGVVHRDIKPRNLLLDRQHNLKLADFGLSTARAGEALRTFCGSPHFTAPEIFLRRPYAGPAADVWSLGVVLYLMVAGTLPFHGATVGQIARRVLSGRLHVPGFLSGPCRDLLRAMLTLDPQRRSSLAAVQQHPWVRPRAGLLASPEPPAGPGADASGTDVLRGSGGQAEGGPAAPATPSGPFLRARRPRDRDSGEGLPRASGDEPSPEPGRKAAAAASAPLGPPAPPRDQAPPRAAGSQASLQVEDAREDPCAASPRPPRGDAPAPSAAAAPGPQESKSRVSAPAPQPAPSDPRPPPSRRGGGWRLKIRRNAVAPTESPGREDSRRPAVPPASSGPGGRGRGRSILTALRKLCLLCSNRVHPAAS